MKYLIILCSLFALLTHSFAQEDYFTRPDNVFAADTNIYRIVLANGNEIIGKIISQDRREVLVITKDKREILIPQYEIKEFIVMSARDFNLKGVYLGEDKFATRYFITTNGLPIKKGEHYIQWNLFGPDFQFSVTDNFGIGVMTTWVGIPFIGTLKYSFNLGENTQFAVGFLAGTGTWAAPTWGGILPFGTISFGNRQANIAFSAGYGGVWTGGNFQGRTLASVAFMAKLGLKISIVFDTFILLPSKNKNPITGDFSRSYDSNLFALIIPGLRWHLAEGRAFQFGLTAVYNQEEFVQVPIPMVQWYRSF